MTNHKSAGPESQHLCESLFKQLQKRLGPLIYKQGKDQCSIGNAKGSFLCVNNHAKAYGSLSLWFRGDADRAKSSRGLAISSTAPKPYGGSFKVRNEKQLREAVKLLSTISYPKSP